MEFERWYAKYWTSWLYQGIIADGGKATCQHKLSPHILLFSAVYNFVKK